MRGNGTGSSRNPLSRISCRCDTVSLLALNKSHCWAHDTWCQPPTRRESKIDISHFAHETKPHIEYLWLACTASWIATYTSQYSHRRGYPSGGCVGRSTETSATRSAPSRRRTLPLRVVAYGIYLSIYHLSTHLTQAVCYTQPHKTTNIFAQTKQRTDAAASTRARKA